MRTSLAPPATPRSTLVGVRAWVHRHRIVSYVVLAYALSWSWWIPLALHGSRTAPGQGWPTHLPGLLGPALAAVIVTALADGRAGLRELTARALRWRIRWRWYVLLIATVAMLGLAPLIATLRGDPLPTAPEYLTYSGLAVLPALPTLLIVLLVNGFGEELGWRGFLADDLLRRHGMLSSALMVTPIWVLWHVPTFWVVETYRSFGPVNYVGWMLGLTCGSVVLTWMYRGSGRSVALVALWHAAFNVVTATTAGAGTPQAAASTVVMVGAVVLALRDHLDQPDVAAS